MVCAGMGGGLMRKILSEGQTKTESFRELILQPQSEMEQFRAWLGEKGYHVTDENMIEEDGKFYPMMKVEFAASPSCRGHSVLDTEDALCKLNANQDDTGHKERMLRLIRNAGYGGMEDEMLCKLSNRYGFYLLSRRNAVLRAYLRREEKIYGEILANLEEQGLQDKKRALRHKEIAGLAGECRLALELIFAGNEPGDCSGGFGYIG